MNVAYFPVFLSGDYCWLRSGKGNKDKGLNEVGNRMCDSLCAGYFESMVT